MAPALTEPLSPNNTLTASTSSASPRPSLSSKTTNNRFKNSSISIVPAGILVNGNVKNKQISQKNFGIIENNNSQINTIFRHSVTSTCAFQSAFEESIKKAGISLPEKQTKNSTNNLSSSNLRSVLLKTKENSSKENTEKLKTEPIQLNQDIENKITSKSNNLNSFGLLTNGRSELLSTSSMVCKTVEAKTESETTNLRTNKILNKLMGPMSDTIQKDSQDIFSEDFIGISEPDQETKIKEILPGFIPIDKDFEEAINKTLKISTNKKIEFKNKHNLQSEKNQELLLKLEDLQQMDLNKCNDDNNVNISKNIIESSENVNITNDAKVNDSKIIRRITINENCDNIQSNTRGTTNKDVDADENIIIACDTRNSQTDIEFSQHEIRSTGTTDTTVSASEGESNFLEDNFPDSTQTLCHSQDNTQNKLINQRSPPKTPVSSSQHLSQIIGTSVSSILTPPSIGLGSTGMGLQKDYKDSEIDDQVLSDMDLLQVLKNFDTTTGGDNLCDLAGNLGLFNDVDVMNYEEIAVPNSKESDGTLDVRNSIDKSHQQMERKCEYLLRRLRKLQSRYMGKHTSEEICGLFEWTNRLVRRKDQHEQIPALTFEEDKHRPVSAAAMRTLLKKIDSVSKAQHSNATDPSSQPLKKYKCSSRSTSSSLINSSSTNRDHLDKKGSNLASSTHGITNLSATVIKAFDEKTTDEIRHVSGLLHSEIRQVQCAFDSDATASSSGGESADEMITYNNQLQQPLSISKRASWRWARDRSLIASRWTWLCAQISDLEYRIRQHNEVYQQIRKNKGVVQLETPISKTKCENKHNTNVEIGLTSELSKDKIRNDVITSCGDNITINSTNNVNGYRGNLNVNKNSDGSENKLKSKLDSINECGDTSVVEESENDDDLESARTRAFQRSGFRKRKLLQTANVHTVSKKAARSSSHCSTVKCGCQWPLNPCALCTGRTDPTAPRDLPDTMMPAERIALLDPTFHPVLSFTEDVPTSIHIEAILHMPEWQNKLIRTVSKTSKMSRKSEDRASTIRGDITPKRPYNKTGLKNRKDSTTSTSTNKVKKSRKNHDYPLGYSPHSGITQSPQNSSNSFIKNKNRKQSSSTMLSSSSFSPSHTFSSNNVGIGLSGNRENDQINSSTSINGFQSAFAESLSNSFQCDNLDGSSNGVLPRSKNTSPTPGIAGINKQERHLERRNRNSYDIDNIVIPYSVAASTRVELLPYKEIPTPKWRVINDSIKEENVEDVIDEEIENKVTEDLADFDLKTNISDIELAKSILNFDSEDDQKIPNEIKSINEKIPKFCHIDNIVDEEDLSHDDISLNEHTLDEDISIEAIQSRHDRALLEERKKFSTYLKFPWSTRSRANRRIDSRAESSGANTPDPTSPAPHTPSNGGDQESIPSPAAPATSVQGDPNDADTSNCNFGHRRERKRTVSSKKDKDMYGVSLSSERRSQSPDPREIIPPYEPLQFPIPDDIFEKMLELMPCNNEDIDDNSNFDSSHNTLENSTNNNSGILNCSTSEGINKKFNGSNSRKNSLSFNLSDTFNENMSCSILSSTSAIINEYCNNNDNKTKNNNNNNNYSNNNINNNYNMNEKDIDSKNNFNIGNIPESGRSSHFHEYFDSDEKTFLLPGESDTDSAESGVDDPNDPEWKEPEK